MCNENVASSDNYSGPPIVKEEWSTYYMVFAVLSTILVIAGGIVTTNSPGCQYHSYYSSRNYPGYGYYYPGAVCYTSFAFLPPMIATSIVVVSLNFAGLRQLLTKAPADAGSNHFCCMFTWAIVLGSLNMGLTLATAIINSFPVGHGSYYSCYYYYYSSSFYSGTCSEGRAAFNQWVDSISRQSAGAQGFYCFASWLFFLMVMTSVILPSRISYWCTTECKDSCPDCAMTTKPTADCDCSCVCCLYADGQSPPQTNQPGSAVAMTAMPAQGGVPLAVNQAAPVAMQPQSMMANEVQYWLTTELGLPQYVQPFVQNGYTTLSAVLYSFNSDADLRRIVPNVLPGHVALILSNLQAKRQYSQPMATQPAMQPVPQAGTSAPPAYGGEGATVR